MIQMPKLLEAQSNAKVDSGRGHTQHCPVPKRKLNPESVSCILSVSLYLSKYRSLWSEDKQRRKWVTSSWNTRTFLFMYLIHYLFIYIYIYTYLGDPVTHIMHTMWLYARVVETYSTYYQKWRICNTKPTLLQAYLWPRSQCQVHSSYLL